MSLRVSLANNVSNGQQFARTLDNTIKHAGIIASNKWSSTRNYDGLDYSCAARIMVLEFKDFLQHMNDNVTKVNKILVRKSVEKALTMSALVISHKCKKYSREILH